MIRGTDCLHLEFTRASVRQVHAWPAPELYCGCETSIRNAAELGRLGGSANRSGTFPTRSLYSTRSAYTVSMDAFSRVVCGTLDDRVIRMPMLMAMRQMLVVLTIIGGLGNVCRPNEYIAGTSMGPTVTFWVNPKTAGISDRSGEG